MSESRLTISARVFVDLFGRITPRIGRFGVFDADACSGGVSVLHGRGEGKGTRRAVRLSGYSKRTVNSTGPKRRTAPGDTTVQTSGGMRFWLMFVPLFEFSSR